MVIGRSRRSPSPAAGGRLRSIAQARCSAIRKPSPGEDSTSIDGRRIGEGVAPSTPDDSPSIGRPHARRRGPGRGSDVLTSLRITAATGTPARVPLIPRPPIGSARRRRRVVAGCASQWAGRLRPRQASARRWPAPTPGHRSASRHRPAWPAGLRESLAPDPRASAVQPGREPGNLGHC